MILHTLVLFVVLVHSWYLDRKSLIDHVFAKNDILLSVSNYRIVLDVTNLSDHLPTLFSLPVTSSASVSSNAKTPVYVYIWDKSDLL